MNNEQPFRYTYSAKEQAELKRIREKYAPASETEDKMERLRRLDRSVTQKAQIVSLVFGVIGCLIMGIGMSLAMTELSDILGSYQAYAMIIGVVIGVPGAVLVGLAYPVYQWIVKRERKKIAPEIIRLSDELMK